ncbi:MAG: Flp family type IVb pilin [Proteobacteria bacterium]|nr:Flp family type IVb pilin [Pseudomonadota bacterium]
MRVFKRFMDDETGATAIEYGLVAALITVTMIANLERLGNTILTIFSKVETTMSNNVK